MVCVGEGISTEKTRNKHVMLFMFYLERREMGQNDRQTGMDTQGWRDRQIEMDKQTEGQTDKQIEIQRERQTNR